MKISSRLDYAISCVLRVADRYETGKPVTVSEISRLERIENDYVEQLLIILKRAGILKSIRGSAGGYILAAAPERISAKKVVEAFEKDVLEFACYRKKGRRNKCVHLDECRIRDFWKGLRKCMESYLADKNLKELLLLRRKESGFKRRNNA